MPHLIGGQVGIKIKTSITGGKESNLLWRICLNQDEKTIVCPMGFGRVLFQ